MCWLDGQCINLDMLQVGMGDNGVNGWDDSGGFAQLLGGCADRAVRNKSLTKVQDVGELDGLLEVGSHWRRVQVCPLGNTCRQSTQNTKHTKNLKNEWMNVLTVPLKMSRRWIRRQRTTEVDLRFVCVDNVGDELLLSCGHNTRLLCTTTSRGRLYFREQNTSGNRIWA